MLLWTFLYVNSYLYVSEFRQSNVSQVQSCTSSLRITGDLVGNANIWTPPQTYWIRHSGDADSDLFKWAPQESPIHSQVWEPLPENCIMGGGGGDEVGYMHLTGLSKAMVATYTPTHHYRSLYCLLSWPTLHILRIFNFPAHPVCANGSYCDLILAFLISSEVDYFLFIFRHSYFLFYEMSVTCLLPSFLLNCVSVVLRSCTLILVSWMFCKCFSPSMAFLFTFKWCLLWAEGFRFINIGKSIIFLCGLCALYLI